MPRLRLRQEPMENYKYLALEVLLIKFDIQYSLLRRSINLVSALRMFDIQVYIHTNIYTHKLQNAICDEEIARRRENMDKCGKQRSALRARLARMAASTS